MLSDIFRNLAKIPSLRRMMWRRWYQYLARKYDDTDWTFMNYGYIDSDADAPEIILAPEEEGERYSAQLYHRVANAVNIQGKDVLEVGSGRGGGAAHIAKQLNPASMKGVDIAARAVDLANSRFDLPNLSYSVGDAENLPFEDGEFFAVVNVESSHGYGSMPKFLSEVGRVLEPGGYFLFADLRPADYMPLLKEQFKNSGMNLIEEEDIAPNVVKALEADNERKTKLIGNRVPNFMKRSFIDFAGIRGSHIWLGLESGTMAYLRVVLQKPKS